MIQLIPQLRILLACQAVDFRNGIDGLAPLCQRVLDEDPFSGTLFVFRNRRGTALKLLCYDGVGFWLTRRFHTGLTLASLALALESAVVARCGLRPIEQAMPVAKVT